MYVAAVGARFEVPGRIEFQDIVVDKKQNVQSNGYGEENREGSVLTIFAKFYGKNDFPVYEEALQHPCKYEVVKSANNDFLFDKEAYTSRIQISAETFLIEGTEQVLSRGLGTGSHRSQLRLHQGY